VDLRSNRCAFLNRRFISETTIGAISSRFMRRVIACHLILTGYGFWLPNDPRGSWSEFVRAWELRRFGPATKVTDGRSRAHDPHDAAMRREAKKHLARKPVRFTGLQARAIAQGFSNFVRRSGITIHACAIMPDHCHLVVNETPLLN
jgi:hypothetical protein